MHVYTIRAKELHYYCVTSHLVALWKIEKFSALKLFYLSECSEKTRTQVLYLSCDECLYDVVRINKDWTESVLDMLYILTQHHKCNYRHRYVMKLVGYMAKFKIDIIRIQLFIQDVKMCNIILYHCKVILIIQLRIYYLTRTF